MIDQYGCDENDFICKVNARQALANQQTAVGSYNSGGAHTPQEPNNPVNNVNDLTQKNWQSYNSPTGMTPQEQQMHVVGMAVGAPIGQLTQAARGVANVATGINPRTGRTYDHYDYNTNDDGVAIGTRSPQRGYANSWEQSVAEAFGFGSPEHFSTISDANTDTTNNTEQNKEQGFMGILGQISNALGIGNSGDTSDGGNGESEQDFHGSDHNWSDVRLKDNIEKIGDLENGLGFYKWEWNNSAKALGVSSPNFGVLAQEVKEIIPNAVIKDRTGYYKVDYNSIKF